MGDVQLNKEEASGWFVPGSLLCVLKFTEFDRESCRAVIGLFLSSSQIDHGCGNRRVSSELLYLCEGFFARVIEPLELRARVA